MMKAHQYLALLLLALLIPFSGRAQTHLPWDLWLNPSSKNFADIQHKVEAWFEGRDKGKGTGYKHWKRWEEFNRNRLDVNGNIVNIASLNLEAYRNQRPDKEDRNRNTEGDWKPWCASSYVEQGSWSPGIGRVQTVAFHPTDPDILYVGAPAGGMFKTTDHGESWVNLSDTLSSIGVSGIAINPENTDNIFILTGDGDGANTRCIGVYKTTNGGDSWTPTTLTWSDTLLIFGRRLLIEPGYPSYMLVATSVGIWQSTDSGDNWSIVALGDFYDIEYKPGSTDIVYASTASQVWRSTNWGQTWSFVQSFDATRIELAVTPDNPNAVYLLAGPSDTVPTMTPPFTGPGFKGVWYSSNSGISFSKQVEAPNILSGNVNGNDYKDQTTWDLAMVVSPLQDSIILTGGVNQWKSVNRGQSFSINSHWTPSGAQNAGVSYVHADIHYMAYNPINNRVYSANDGGIFYSVDDGENWIDITEGLNISQLYHFAGTDQDLDLMIGGMQDNGTGIFTESDTLISVLGADGGDVLIDPTNSNIMYAMTQEGDLLKSVNGGDSFSSIKPPASGVGPFVTRWAMDPNDPLKIYVGWVSDTIYKTVNGGTTWTKVKMPGGYNQSVTSITVANNSTTLYATTPWVAWRSLNSGNTWAPFDTAFAPGGNYTSIRAHPSAFFIATLTRGGFGPANKVLEYNALTNLTNPIVGTGSNPGALPNVPVNVSAYHATNGELYVGTDIGVYVYRSSDSDAGWQKFKRGFPNTIVTDIEIYESQGIMRAGTFGRGIWQSDVWDDCVYDIILTQGNDPDNGMPIFQFHEAADAITSNRIINGPFGIVTYKAGDLIILSDGFRATESNTVRVGVKPCGINLN